MRASLPLALALALAACSGGQHQDSSVNHRDHAHHPAHDGDDAHHGDLVPHDHMSTQDYYARLEDPGRAAWQLPEQLVAALRVPSGGLVADVGTGSGYFLPLLNRAVGASGRVVAEDIDNDLLGLVRQRVAREQLSRVDVRLGAPDDPRLEAGQFNLVLLVDTYHHIENRPVFLGHIARALDPRTGRFVVVDFREGDVPVGPPPEHKIAREVIVREAHDAGLELVHTSDFLPYQFVLEFAVAGYNPAG